MALRHGLGITGNNQGVVTSADHKLDQLGMVVKTGNGNEIRQGIFYNGVTNIVSGTAGTSTNDRGYSVAPFTAALSRGAGSGVIFITNDGTATPATTPALRTTAADSSNPRVDTVYVWQREYILDGQDSEPVFGVVQGTPAAIPQAPLDTALPAGALRLADFTVPAGATNTNASVATQRAPFTAMHGGAYPVPTDGLLGAAVRGQEAWALDTGIIYTRGANGWESSGWRGYTPSLAGFGTGVSVLRARWATSGNTVVGKVTVRTSANGLAATCFVSLPVPPASSGNAKGDVVGAAYFSDQSGGSGASRTGVARLDDPTGGSAFGSVSFAVATGGNANANNPFTWAADDVLTFEFRYEKSPS